MTVRVMLLSPALTDDGRQARFGGNAPLDGAAVRRVRAAAAAVPDAARVLTGPSVRCTGTAAALGLDAVATPELADCDWGRWEGHRLNDLAAAEPRAIAAWLSDPDAAPHGGESVAAFGARIRGWLDGLDEPGGGTEPDGGDEPDRRGGRAGRGEARGPVLAVVEAAVVRAAVVNGLGLPAQAFWRIDVAPLTLTELTGRAGRWNLRCGQPL
ncbi:histidine phosphatase family protein [Kitasatospora sp. CM 4170]|uniref:Histidine phosphatase family protein n=1 Tax=Kitasatospora aburaviensis TaxID=67265 RepID=A0ABW1F9H9_9ACTN|nr:histidine phosphatase family protein [Kitasatospora sp. CM 4170]WNM49750.1 histidine phosphatase family protein [Kitasatospora sp. CM 4170]